MFISIFHRSITTRSEMRQETRSEMNNEQMTNAAGQNMMGMSNGPMGYSF